MEKIMKKIILTFLISTSMLQAFNHATVKGCIMHVYGDYEIYCSLKNTSIEYMKSMNILSVGGYKIDDSNYKEVLKAWKRCNK